MNNPKERKMDEICEILDWNTLETESVKRMLNTLKSGNVNEEVLGRIQGMQSNLLFAQEIMLQIVQQAKALKKCLLEKNN